MNEFKCDKCGAVGDIEEHHLHPRFMDNKKGDGIKIWLCKKCHLKLHLKIIPSIIFYYVQDKCPFDSWKTKQNCIEYVKKRTKKWIEEEDGDYTSE